MPGVAVLNEGAGYGVVLGLGLFFSALMVGVTAIQNRYSTHKTSSAAEYASASHSVKPGLISTALISAWTWAATLLQSSAVAYKFGISGPWWYAAGATVQILLFAQNAVKLKINAPHATTFAQVIRARWGRAGHSMALCFGLATNVIVSSMLMTGGSATITDLTGMPTEAACMLVPLSVTIYVLVGGMRASILADFIHTAFLFAIILTFAFVVYATSEKIGSPGAMYDLLKAASDRAPVKDNAGGSYLTMRSKSGLIFGVINIIGNFATVYNDQAYWQRAIASKPVSCVKGFILGGSAWTSIPLGFATTMGLAAVALDLDLTPAQVSAGLPAPAAAAALLGKTGAALMLVLLFLAITSAASAEIVAVSSLLTFDIYVPYFNPSATEKQILAVDHAMTCLWGLFMGILGIIFFHIGISMGWLYEFMGVILGGAVVPIALGIMSSRASKWGCIGGAWAGLAAGVIAWLVTTKTTAEGGVISIATTSEDYPMLAGNLASLGTSALICTITTLIWPENFDFDITRAIGAEKHAAVEASSGREATTPDADFKDEKSGDLNGAQPLSARESINEESTLDENEDPVKLRAAFRLAVMVSIALFIVLIMLIPLPLFFSSHIYPKAGFYVWICMTMIWVFYGSFVAVVYPIFESRESLGSIGKMMWADITGRGKSTSAK